LRQQNRCNKEGFVVRTYFYKQQIPAVSLSSTRVVYQEAKNL